MKALIVLFLMSAFSSYADVNYKTLKCSNSDGTVKWESGVNEDLIHLSYSHFVEGVLTLELDQVNIDLEHEILVQEKSIKECTYAALHRVFASKVKITPSDKNPNVMQSLFPENIVETEVICSLHLNTPRFCPTKNI